MKKIIIGLCILLIVVIGFPMATFLKNTVSANDDVPLGETAVDVVFGYRENNMTYYTYVITNAGNLFFADHYYNGEVFIPITDERTSHRMPDKGKPLDKIKKVSAYGPRQIISGIGVNPTLVQNVMALRTDGSVYVWGNNEYGQFGNGKTDNEMIEKPVLIKPNVPSEIVDVLATDSANYLLLENGDVYASGDGSHGMLANGSTESTTTFSKVNISDVKKLAGGYDAIYALKNDGSVYTWGRQIYDGKAYQNDVGEPTVLYKEDGTPFVNVVDISCEAIPMQLNSYGPGVTLIAIENGMANGYQVGYLSFTEGKGPSPYIHKILSVPVSESSDVKNAVHCIDAPYTMAMVVDGVLYTKGAVAVDTPAEKVIKGWKTHGLSVILSESGAVYVNGIKAKLDLGLKVTAKKSTSELYKSEEKYNDNVTIEAVTSRTNTVTCKMQDPVGSTESVCNDFNDNKLHVASKDERVYRKYLFTDTIASKELIVDLYKGTPELTGFSSTLPNKIKVTDSISLAVPADQAAWNSYTATITDSSDQTTNFTGGTLAKGLYTLHITDAYGNTKDYQFDVTDKPDPTVEFNPANSSLAYGDNPTKVNQTIGTFALKYPQGEPTSNIKTIQLGTSGNESYFTVDTSGALKVKGTDLDAGTYSVTVSGTDGNDMAFTKTVSITVNKKNQDNYQITNQANYPFQLNQEIAITTSGNDSGENETYTITNGNSVAQISNSTKFKLLSAGTFTLQATVAGNTNYNSKTVTKQITVSQLPTQNPPVSITSNDSFMYGDTYTPSYSGGQGSGAVSWTIESDNGTEAALSNGKVTVTGVGTFTIKVTKAGTSSYQASTATKVITVNKRRTTVKPKNVTKTVGQVFKDNGATYTPQPIAGDNIGTLVITSKYPNNQAPGQYTDGIQASGLSNPNYDFIYQEGTLIINSNALPNNGAGYYTVSGTKGKNNWYISDVEISATGKNGYDEISNDGINFQTTPLVYSTDGDYPTDFYLRN